MSGEAPIGVSGHGGAVARSTKLTLPPDLLEKGRQRVKWLSVIFAALSIVAIIFDVTLQDGELARYHLMVLAMDAALFGAASLPGLPAAVALNAALVYEVAMCQFVSFTMTRYMFERTGILTEPVWTSILIVAFPLIVPMVPSRVLIASMLSAITVPVGIYAVQVDKAVTFELAQAIAVSITPLFCVIIAYFGSRFVYGISLDIAAARRMGPYQLEERLGAGGMGEVWRAQHRLLVRPAAIKLVRQAGRGFGGGDSSALEASTRFEREAQVTAQLQSPHTVELYDFGTTEDGTFYYVMEMLHGLDLETLVEQHGPLPPERVVHALLQICHSLAEAHTRGLVHRDVKPANIFLCRYGSDLDFVKVLDFGLVTLEGEWGEGADGLTSEGRVPGTPAYMAPETIVDPASVDGRADLYALGAVAFWMLTGTHVFAGQTPTEVLVAHVNEPPRPPSAMTEVDIPPELDALVLACLAKDPSDRPRNAAALAAALRKVPIDAPWTADRSDRWWRAHRPELLGDVAGEQPPALSKAQRPAG